ncbi:MAG: hypothetical protein R2750_05420 [Bacteroidales bacterium]
MCPSGIHYLIFSYLYPQITTHINHEPHRNIIQHCKSKSISIASIARQLNITRSGMYKILRHNDMNLTPQTDFPGPQPQLLQRLLHPHPPPATTILLTQTENWQLKEKVNN